MPIISGGSNGAPEVIAELQRRDKRAMVWNVTFLILGFAGIVLAIFAFVPR
jgi:hypothetical protein